MDYKTITGVFKPKKYSIEDFIYKNEESIKDESFDFDYYKKQYGDKMDDEFLALFELIENSDLSKKEVKLMSMMLRKMYEEKYKESVNLFLLKPEDVILKNEENHFFKNDIILKNEEVHEVQEVKEIKIYNKQTEFNESNTKDFYEIIKKMEDLEVKEE